MKYFKWIALSLALIITPPAQAQDYPLKHPLIFADERATF